MNEYLNDIKSEVKRIDHLIYVSLKYTRTVDVIRSVVQRMMNVFEIAIEAMLEKANRKKKIEIPPQPLLKIKLVRELYPSKKFDEYMDFYLRLREIFKAKYSRREEFRRHVTMLSETETGFVEVNIDSLNIDYEKIKNFVEYIEAILLSK